ncbi:MAG: FtsX-like permease family protein [Lachnospiraceae bacterium]|nr:FtsX-like permease family protein [Lachnospiraceae bacterium]
MNNNKIVFQVTWAYMKKNRRRTLITFAGIVVMVMLMTAVFVGRDTVLDFLTNAVAAEKGSWHAQVYDLNADQVEQVKALRYVKQVEVSRPLGYLEFPQSGNKDMTPFLEVKGYSEGMFSLLNIHLTEGRYPQNENEIILSERARQEGSDVKVGDVVEGAFFERYMHAFSNVDPSREGEDNGFIVFSSGFSIGHGETQKLPDHFPYFISNDEFEVLHEPTGREGSLTIVGFMEMPYYETQGMGGYIALAGLSGTGIVVHSGESVNVVLTKDLRSKDNISYDLNVIVNSSRTPEELAELAEHGAGIVTPDGRRIPIERGRVVVNDTLLMFADRGSDGTFYAISIFFQAFFVILITVASMVLIYNVFSISFFERSQYLGMLSSVGATRAQKRSSVYIEVLILLGFALPLGILGGILVIKVGMGLLYPHFSEILGMIAQNVIAGRSNTVGYHLVIRPSNLLLVVVFSALAVWASAWIPARRVGKIGPIESIRGTEEIKVKKGTNLSGLLKKGRAEQLLAFAGITRNGRQTRGIIRSICAFLILTTVTAFSAMTITDLVEQKANNDDFRLGDGYQGYEYVFTAEDEAFYEEGKLDICTSDETSGYREFAYNLFCGSVKATDLNEEYLKYHHEILDKYFPNGVPDQVWENFYGEDETAADPYVNILVVDEETFADIQKKAKLPEVTAEEGMPTVLVYDRIRIGTEEYKNAFEGAVIPDYAKYEIKNPIRAKTGETFSWMTWNAEEKKMEAHPFLMAGHVSEKDLQDVIYLADGQLWLIMKESDDAMMKDRFESWGHGIGGRYMFFSVFEGQENLIRRLSNMKDKWGESALSSAKMQTGMVSFAGAISKIINILAVCFTFLVSLISFLNLYNSVMGRKLARQKELSVLASMGTTKWQRSKMLCIENVVLLLKSFLFGSVITTAFVVFLHQVVSDRFGKILFHMPVWMIVLPILASILGLTLFTALCYGEKDGKSILEEIRAESV